MEDKIKRHLKSVLDWWEDAQFQESCPGRNMYDYDPDMVITAKQLWVENYGGENPSEWIWLKLDEI